MENAELLSKDSSTPFKQIPSNNSEARELRAGKMAPFVAVISTFINAATPVSLWLTLYLTSPHKILLPSWLIISFGFLGVLYLQSMFNLLRERLASCRNYLRADEAGITLHESKHRGESRHVFVPWEDMASLTEIEGDKKSHNTHLRAGTMTLRDSADNILLQWSLNWPTTFASARRAREFYEYLRTRLPSRRVKALRFTKAESFPRDELREGETLKIPVYALLEAPKLLASLGFIGVALGCLRIKSELGIFVLILWNTFIIWYATIPCFLELDVDTLKFTHGSRSQSKRWDTLIKVSRTKGSFFGKVVLCGGDGSRLVLPSSLTWNRQVRQRALLILCAEAGHRTSLGGIISSPLSDQSSEDAGIVAANNLVLYQPLSATTSYVYNDKRVVQAIIAPLVGLFLCGHFLGEGLGMIVFFPT